MDRIQEILAKFGSATSFDMSPRDYEQFKVDGLNNTVGNRNEEDGYDCPICKNKGTIYKVVDYGDGYFSHCACDCKCAEIRRSIMRMKRSGLKDIIKDYTFDKFEDTEPWQKAIKEAAMAYAENPEGWFALCAQSGSGKTHLCTAICREFLLAGRKVVYMLWRDEIVRIKEAAKGDDSSLQDILEKYKSADVLYIDDLFKTGKDKFDAVVKPSVADINYAFEIINFRYNNPKLLTIVSSELSEEELLDIDEAIGGRIYERAKTFTIAKSRDRNYRIRKAVTL
jgi:DNA replication protein DnaC